MIYVFEQHLFWEVEADNEDDAWDVMRYAEPVASDIELTAIEK